MHGHVVALFSFAWLGLAAPAPPKPTEPVVEAKSQPTTGMWVGLRGGPPKLRTALAAALQTQASIRGIIDRVAPDVVSLQACAWTDIACFVSLGERHDSRVLVVADLARRNDRYLLRVARINVDLGQVIAEYRMEIDPELAAIDIANHAIAGLTGEVVAAPRTVATPTEASASEAAPTRSKRRSRLAASRRVSPPAQR